MRADMKLAMVMVPITMGLVMALLSGMAKAEDKAAKPQPLADAVSAQTSLPSVGHRPDTPIINEPIVLPYQDYSPSISLPVGTTLYSRGPRKDIFRDIDTVIYGASDHSDKRSMHPGCRVYRVASDSSETLIYESKLGDTDCPTNYLYLTENEIGHRIKIEYFHRTSKNTGWEYEPTPSESLPHVFITSQTVTGIYDAKKIEVLPKQTEIPHSDPKGIEVTVKAADYKNRPATGLSVTIDGGRTLSYTSPVDNGDGTYTTYLKSSRPGTETLLFLLNGTGVARLNLSFK